MQNPAEFDTSGLGALINPYDFAKPVTRPDRFAGRETELADVRYYLKLAKNTPEPMNLAVIGDRASGKTSMLNIIDIESKEMGLITARINLNSADADPINFFWKLYDALIDSYSTAGYLFKPGSDEEITYRRIIDSLDPEADSPNFPLRFPGHYALAVKGGRQISEVKLQRDLTYIYELTKAPCILIFDECNVMAQNRVILEMLRNIFMNISGYMTVLTGTPSFFPLLDEVFSPIIRQFKKINIQPFKESDDTRQCVINPLRSLSLNPAKLVSGVALYDIHTISQGRPYEIQLLCHFMFRRLQDQRATEMIPNADVMDDVLNELEATISGTTDRPIVAAVRNMTEEQLAAVSVFGRADGFANFDFAWFMQTVFNPETQFTRDDLARILDELKTLGIFQVKETDQIKFAGDDFERIYLRYHAERLGLSVVIDAYPASVALTALLVQALRDMDLNAEWEIPRLPTLEKAVDALLKAPGSELPELSLTGVRPIFSAMNHGQLVLVRIIVSFGDERAPAWLWWPSQSGSNLTDNPNFLKLKDAIESNGGDVSIEMSVFDMPTEEEFITKVLSSPNKQLQEKVGDQIASLAVDEYILDDDDAALAQIRRANLFMLSSDNLNNIGYIYMALGHYNDAEIMISQAVARAEKEKNYKLAALAHYNLAMCKILSLHCEDAMATLLRAQRMLDGDYVVRCLFVPVPDGETLALKEMWEPELSVTIEAAIAVLETSPTSHAPKLVRRQVK